MSDEEIPPTDPLQTDGPTGDEVPEADAIEQAQEVVLDDDDDDRRS